MLIIDAKSRNFWIESIEMPLKRVASLMPPLIQQEFRRWKIWVDFKRGVFSSQEPEFQLLPRLLIPETGCSILGPTSAITP